MSVGLPDLRGAPVGVLGAGITGRAVARALAELGARPIVVDTRQADEAPEGAVQDLSPVAAEVHWADPEPLARTTLVVLSPGVPIDSPFLDVVRAAGVEIIGEVELAYRLRPDAVLVGITGTNGKSTTTSLTGAMLQASSVPTEVCGNIGTPLISYILGTEGNPVFVVELSSFQLESCSRLHVRSAALLNISDDHRDRHPSMEQYIRTKLRLFNNQTADDCAVLGADCEVTRGLAGAVDPAALLWFSAADPVTPGAYAQDDTLWLCLADEPPHAVLAIEEMALRGTHNVQNACAAICLAASRGATLEGIGEALRTHTAARHTFEVIGTVRGVVWINDSKGTNVDSTLRALESCPGPVILIAGGSAKEADYSPLGPAISRHCRAVLALGKTGPAITAVARAAGLTQTHECHSMEEAVRRAADLATPGDCVLLSPASASFGMFRNYAHRGDCFVQAVRTLEGFVPADRGGAHDG